MKSYVKHEKNTFEGKFESFENQNELERISKQLRLQWLNNESDSTGQTQLVYTPLGSTREARLCSTRLVRLESVGSLKFQLLPKSTVRRVHGWHEKVDTYYYQTGQKKPADNISSGTQRERERWKDKWESMYAISGLHSHDMASCHSEKSFFSD